MRKLSVRPLLFSAAFFATVATVALTVQFAKSVQQRKSASQNAAVASHQNAAPALKAGARGAQPFDTDQSCGLNCTATVPATGTVNTAINFQASASASGCATTPTYEWNFGDGSPVSTQQNPTKTYTAAGTYTWTMTTSASTGATGIDTYVGGYGEGNAALQSPYGALLAVTRDPLGRGIFLVERLNDTSYIRFVNTTAAPVTIAGKTIAGGANRFLAGGGLDPFTENLRGSSVDLGNVAGIGVKPDGNLLYFSNSLDQIVRVINLSSTVQTVTGGTVNVGNVRTFAVSGASFGTGLSSITVGANGTIYVCDATPGINKIYSITDAGVATVFAGNGASTQDVDTFSAGAATAIPLLAPRAIEFDGNDAYIADTGHGRVIKVTNGTASLISQFTIGSGNKLKAFPPFDTAPIIPPFPSGLAFYNGKLYIAMGNSQVIVRMDGATPTIVAGTKTTSCEYTSTNCGDGGTLSNMLFSLNGSSGIAQPIVGFEADSNGIYISDQASPQRGRIRFLNFGNSTATVNGVAINAGSGDTVVGNGSTLPYNGNLASSAGIFSPSGTTLDPNGNLFFVERAAGRIRFVNRGSNPVTLFAATESEQTVQPGRIITINRDLNLGNTAQEGPVVRTTFDNPQGIFATNKGVFIVDTQGGPSVKTNPSDPATTINKTRTSLVRFINTTSSNVTFYPSSSSPIVVTPGNIGTIAGGGTASPSVAPEGFALSIVMAGASDIIVTSDGTLYIADTGNKKVRKINPNTGTSSSLTLPTGSKQYVGLALDSAGKLYICNYDDSQLLRENTAGGGTFARMDGGGLNRPRDVVVDGEGNAFVVNSQVSDASPGTNANQIVRVAAAGGTATTIAGSTSAGFSGDGGLAANAQISVSPANPSYTVGTPNNTAPIVLGIVRDTTTGQILFSDIGNERIRVLSTAFASCTKTGTITISGTNPLPTLANIAPTTALAGSGALTLTLTGTGFTPSSVAKWNGSDRVTTFVSNTQLTAQILSTDVASAGTALISVFNPTPGGGTSSSQTFTITAPNPVPTMTNLSPSSAAEGSPAFTLTITGTNFVNGSVVRWDGSPRATTFVSATTLTAQITSTDLAGGAGTAQVTVFNPTPGGGTSNSLPFTITTTNPVPTLTNLNPGQTSAGGAAFTLTVTGSSFVPSSVVRWNGNNRATTFVGSTSLTAQITAADIASAGSATITVFNPTPGGGVSNSLSFTVSPVANPVPTLTSINPTSAQAGGAAFSLTLTGTNFLNNSIVRWNGTDRTTTFVSATQLTAQITASDIASVGTAQVTVFNPASAGGGGGTSSAQTFTITQPPNPSPTLTSITPSSVITGGAAFTLTLNGTNFIQQSVVRYNGTDRATTFVSSTSLTIQVSASDIASAGTASLTVFNPAPGGGTSSAQTLSIIASNPTPTIATLNPVSATAGGSAFTLTVNGTNFVNSSVVRWNGLDRTTTFVSATQITAQISAADITNAGTSAVTVFNPSPGGGTSNSVSFSIVQPNPAPVLSGINPSTVIAGSPGFTLTISGSGFIPSSIVRLNGADRNTTFVSATSLTIAVSASDIANVGNATIAVFNPAPGGGTSGNVTLTIQAGNLVPTLSALNPNSITAGGGNLLLTVTGTNFVNASVIRWNGADRPTTFVNSTQLTAQIPASDIASAGTAAVTVFNPAPGGGVSNALSLPIVQPNNPVPTLTNLSQNSAPAGTAPFTLTVTGTNFVNGSIIRFNNQNRVTTFLSATQLSTQLVANDLASAMTIPVTVFNPTPGGGTSNVLNFTVTPALNPVPVITTIAPSIVGAGGATFLLTVNGTGFINGSIVRFNNAERVTTYVSATQITAQILASDIANLGTAAITVFNPASAGGGGGISNAVNLTIATPNPAPTIAQINPAQVVAGGAKFSLTVTGTGFTPSSVVRLRGADRLTMYVSNTTLTIEVAAADVASAGTAAITVVNGLPGGGTSNSVNLSIVNPVTSVSAASYASAIAPESIVAAFGVNLTATTAGTAATTIPLPTTLNGTTVRIRDAAGTEHLAPLFFVSPSQVNYLVPTAVALGTARVTVTSGNGTVSLGEVTVARIEPGLFSANGSGTGLMAADVLRVRANGELVYEPIVRNGVAVPVELGDPTDQVYLIAYGTGLRSRNNLNNVSAKLGTTSLAVPYAGAQGSQIGLDQINLGPIPRSLAGSGSIELTLQVENKTANKVTVTIR